MLLLRFDFIKPEIGDLLTYFILFVYNLLSNCNCDKNLLHVNLPISFLIFRFSNPDKFRSRTMNYIFQGMQGGKGVLKRACGSLMDFMSVECDGVDHTDRLKRYKISCLLFLNIKSYAGGTRPWKKRRYKF